VKTIVILSFIAGVGTSLGALIVCLVGTLHERTLAFFLGLATGIMSSVVILDLIPSSLKYGTLPYALTGFLLGVGFMTGINLLLSSFTSKKAQNRKGYLLKMGYLIAIGIAMHDLPEGIAIAVGYTAADNLGFILLLAIGLHNIPEGMATATPLRMGGMAVWKVLLITSLVTFFTPLGTVIGFWLVNLSPDSLSLLLASAAGAMAYIAVEELYPESQKYHPNVSRLGIFFGIIIISALALI